MRSLSSVPFLRLTVSLSAGIATALFALRFHVSFAWWAAALLMSLSFLGVAFFLLRKKTTNSIPGILLLLSFFLSGLLLGYHSQSVFNRDFFYKENAGKKSRILFLKLEDEITEKPNTWRVPASVFQVLDSAGKTFRVSGRILVYWPKKSNELKPALHYGQVLMVPDLAMPMPSAAFPEDFDFKAVMRYRDMQHQIFLSEGIWQVSTNEGNWLLRNSFLLRNKLIKYFNGNYPKRIAAVLESLLIGYKDEVPAEDLNAFAISGTMHVLAVSGMHVGLLYLLVLLLFTGKKQASQNPVWRGALIILLLWAFAVLTGLSASVVRAALMFSIVEAGRSFFKREGNVINSIFAAAFIQLLFNPLQLIDVGFQLSYLAVLGIVVIYPRLAVLWMPPGKILQFFYQSALVSLAATIATLPVSLYFFGTFPAWFLPANMIIVPLSTLVILAALVTLLFSWIPVLMVLLKFITSTLTELLLDITRFFSNLPAASIKGFQPDEFSAVLILLILVFATLYFVFSRKRSLFVSAVFSFILGCWILVSAWLAKSSNEIVFCELKGRMLFALREGNTATIYSEALQNSTADSLANFMKPYFRKHRVSEVHWQVVTGEEFCHKNVKVYTGFPFTEVYASSGKPLFVVVWNKCTNFQISPYKALLIVQKRFSGSLPLHAKRLVMSNDYCLIKL